MNVCLFLTCICLTARCYSIKKIQCNTVTSLQCCSLCDNLDSRYLYTCMDTEMGRGGDKKEQHVVIIRKTSLFFRFTAVRPMNGTQK